MVKFKTILFVGHEASLSGAPKSLLNIGNICKEAGYNVIFLLKDGGPLVGEYQEIGPVFFWKPDLDQATLFKKVLFRIKGGLLGYRKSLLKRIKNQNPKLILNNTVVNGSILEWLKTLEAPIISRISELETAIKVYNIHGESAKVLQFSDLFVCQTKSDIKRRGLTDSLFYVGRKDDPYPYYGIFNVFFLSSREDTFSRAMLEAAQFGLPIVGFSGTGGIEEFLNEGGGFLAEYGNIEETFTYIKMLKEDQVFYQNTAAEIKEVSKKYSGEFSKAKLLNFVDRVISEHNSVK